VRADALVIGGGIAGLTAASRLLAGGVSVEMVERAPRLPAGGAGIMLHPNALTHLAHLGEPLLGAGSFIERHVVFDPDGTRTVLRWDQVWDGRLPLAIHRQRLAELMLRHLPADPDVRWSTTPDGITQHDGYVRVSFADGEEGTYRIVIGADGLRSWTRRLVDPAATPRYLGQTFWRTTVAAAPPFASAQWRVWRSNGHFFGAMPVGGGRVHVFLQAAFAEPPHVPPEKARERMRTLANSMGDTVESLVDSLPDAEPVHVRPAYGLAVSRWVDGRVVILGDAAHAVSPAATQGGALAVEDAAVLAEEVGRHGPGPAALAAFEARRRPRVDRFLQLARLHGSLLHALQDDQHGRRVAAVPRPTGDAAAWFRRLYAPLMDPA
jgi:2-polyprenyl-6-methoxyphenol hydroxylase-like FAD-dependent oxidoreductase